MVYAYLSLKIYLKVIVMNLQIKKCNITIIRETAVKCPQESYASVIHAIQLEWIFLQCVMKNIRDAFAGVEKLIWETFLPCLFFRK